jgi:PIN domain nuclease of toxin-antitoxin system
VRVLLDTNALLWFLMGSDRLSRGARRLIEEPSNTRLLSIASLWETAIKVSIGKLSLTQPFPALFPYHFERNDIVVLPISVAHVAYLAALPFLHRDPFDRMIIAQSIVESVPVVGSDAVFDAYAVQRLR